jgi:hypothetical protein
MVKEELLKEFETLVSDFIKAHLDDLNQLVNWGKMPDGMLFGNADISSNDFVLTLLRTFKNNGARVIDSGLWQPFPNFGFPRNWPLEKLHAEETVDWNAELGGN